MNWLNLLGTSLVYAVRHGMYIMAHGRAEASKLAPFICTQLLGTVAAGWLFYSQVPKLYTALGAGLIALHRSVASPSPRTGPSPNAVAHAWITLLRGVLLCLTIGCCTSTLNPQPAGEPPGAKLGRKT